MIKTVVSSQKNTHRYILKKVGITLKGVLDFLKPIHGLSRHPWFSGYRTLTEDDSIQDLDSALWTYEDQKCLKSHEGAV